MPGKDKLKILAIGDSTTAGNPGGARGQYPYWIMQKHPDWQVINSGIGGQRTDQILARFEKELDASRPDVVIILAGVNDLYQGRPEENVAANLFKMYRIARQRGLRVVACTILPYDAADEAVRQRMAEVNYWIRSYSREQGLIFCDTFAAVNDPNNPFHLISSIDKMHPDTEGYRRIGEAIADSINKYTL